MGLISNDENKTRRTIATNGGGGLAAGGTTGQQLVKASSTDFDAEWTDQRGLQLHSATTAYELASQVIFNNKAYTNTVAIPAPGAAFDADNWRILSRNIELTNAGFEGTIGVVTDVEQDGDGISVTATRYSLAAGDGLRVTQNPTENLITILLGNAAGGGGTTPIVPVADTSIFYWLSNPTDPTGSGADGTGGTFVDLSTIAGGFDGHHAVPDSSTSYTADFTYISGDEFLIIQIPHSWSSTPRFTSGIFEFLPDASVPNLSVNATITEYVFSGHENDVTLTISKT